MITITEVDEENLIGTDSLDDAAREPPAKKPRTKT